MTTLYPPIAPYEHGMLDVGDGNFVYWETSGNPAGRTAIVLHGGPGSGSTPELRRFFDPEQYRTVMFDQRNCGRSIPHASDSSTSLLTNTTNHLLVDMERLRMALGIDRWVLYGHSWGSVLGLAYAVRHPDRVTHAVLSGIGTGRPFEIDHLYRGLAPAYPTEWKRLLESLPDDRRDGDVVSAYHQILESSDPAMRRKAAAELAAWEWATLVPGTQAPPSWLEPRFQMARSRIVAHYFAHRCWFTGDELLSGATQLGHIPAVIVNGELDPLAPLGAAESLAAAWPHSELRTIGAAGHSNGLPDMSSAIRVALDSFAVGT